MTNKQQRQIKDMLQSLPDTMYRIENNTLMAELADARQEIAVRDEAMKVLAGMISNFNCWLEEFHKVSCNDETRQNYDCIQLRIDFALIEACKRLAERRSDES